MSIPLNIYMYVKTTGYTAGVEQIEVHYVAGKHGLESISPQVFPAEINTPEDPGNDVFETYENAMQYYLSAASATIVAAVEIATGEDFHFFSYVRTEPRDFGEITLIRNASAELEGTIVSNYNEHESEIDGLGVTIAMHTTEETAHPEMRAAMMADIYTKTEVDDAVDTAINNLISSAPGTLNTLDELAASLGDDANFASTITTALTGKVDKVTGKGLSTEDYSSAEKSKLAGIATGATANDTDANLKDRANHTGTQTASTISDFASTAQALGGKSFQGTTQRNGAFPIFKSVTVSSGTAVFHLTSDGTSGGAALFPNGPITESVNAFVSDATASYQMSYAWSNSNKTLTVTANKLTTSNIITGILGQAQANGSTVFVQVWGY
jgi:hypothetical protein